MPRAEIDPQLPYIQVHRSVGQKAAMLAPLLGVTYQHARGSMDCLWESLADRRLLVDQDAIILSQAALRGRLKLAFGCEVDPSLLEGVGFLELEADGRYRVRGMSRYIEAEQARQNKRGGKEADGEPPASVPAPGSNPGGTVPLPRSHPGPTPHAPGSDPAKARGERREVKDERRETKGEAAPRDEPERRAPDSPLRQKPAPTPPPESPDDGLNLRDKLEAVYQAKRRAKYRWRTADDIASREVLAAAEGDWGVVLDVWGRALERTKFPVCNGMADLSRHWNAYAGEEPTEKRSAALSIGQGTAPPLEAIPEPPPILPCEVCAGWGGKELEGHALCVPHMREATRSELVFPEDRRAAGEELGVWIVRKRPGPAEVAA